MRKAAPFMLVLLTLANLVLLGYLFAEGRGSTITRGGLILLLCLLAAGWIFAGLNLKKGRGKLTIGQWVEADIDAEVLDPDEDEEQRREPKDC
jgi:peptidoglycan/LPS O-acetylase OafA/YrhL